MPLAGICVGEGKNTRRMRSARSWLLKLLGGAVMAKGGDNKLGVTGGGRDRPATPKLCFIISWGLQISIGGVVGSCPPQLCIPPCLLLIGQAFGSERRRDAFFDVWRESTFLPHPNSKHPTRPVFVSLDLPSCSRRHASEAGLDISGSI